MSGLQEAFYIIGIVFMSLIFILFIILVSAVLVIRNKISSLHNEIEHKINQLTTIAEKGGEISAIASSAVIKKAKKAIKNKKKR
ncbi:MAG TPA: hypothetical protein VFN51_02070 [Candidatus Saccharimonadales bacterium]|nr:hypothetical protein [Candidatus Saccharimonadales bacterium]